MEIETTRENYGSFMGGGVWREREAHLDQWEYAMCVLKEFWDFFYDEMTIDFSQRLFFLWIKNLR